jgi:hypothetical protein
MFQDRDDLATRASVAASGAIAKTLRVVVGRNRATGLGLTASVNGGEAT